jgi:ribosomal protein L37AE/L43A
MNDAPDIDINVERARFWEAMERQELLEAREEWLSLPCPKCEQEAMPARGELGWGCRNCGATETEGQLLLLAEWGGQLGAVVPHVSNRPRHWVDIELQPLAGR